MENNMQSKQADKLIFFGLVLFLIGLIVGLFIHNMANPRMALSAHLEGVMNGMFLMILGLIWKRLILSKAMLTASYLLVIYGTFANLLAVLLAAATGFGKMMPIAGGKDGGGALEGIITFLLISLALCMIAVCTMVLVGYYRYMHSKSNTNKEVN